MAKFLITSALPYVNGVKHLGNLAGSLLPADIHARFRRQTGHEVLFLCGTDEHGTPSELAAQAARVPVAEYCARQHALQADIYRRFGLSFDHFSRTSGVANRLLTQELFRHLDAAGHIEPRLVRQAYSATDKRFLPDRYVVRTCPHCGSPNARGDHAKPAPARPATSCRRARCFRRDRCRISRDGACSETVGIRVGCADGSRRDAGGRRWCIDRNRGSMKASGSFASRAISPGAWSQARLQTRSSMSSSMRRSAASQRRSNGARQAGTTGAPGGRAAMACTVQFLARTMCPSTISFPRRFSAPGLALKLRTSSRASTGSPSRAASSRPAANAAYSPARLTLLPADSWRWWLAANAPENADTDFTIGASSTV